jgi:DNA invertase Pin-like site-specific DNA recombinase
MVPERAIGYLRVSTTGQEERGSSLASQRERVREHAAAKGYTLIDVVSEAASGGVRDGEELSYEHRPQLLSLLERADRREYDVLLVAKLDRLSRDYPSLAVLERRLQRHDVEVVSTAEENGDGPIAEFIRGQLALVAQLERSMILDRVRAGKATRKREGKHVHGNVPYGYRSVAAPDGKGRTLALVDDTAAAVVRRVFQAAKQGDTPGRIARDLNGGGVTGPRGGEWNRTAVRGMIENIAYSGERYGVKNAHPGIVSRRLFNAANETLARRSR